MAAMRSALAMLSRRSCGTGGSSAAVRNLESWRCMTSRREEPTFKAGNTLRQWWQQAKDLVKNADEEEKSRVFFVYGLFTLGTPSVYTIKSSTDLS